MRLIVYILTVHYQLTDRAKSPLTPPVCETCNALGFCSSCFSVDTFCDRGLLFIAVTLSGKGRGLCIFRTVRSKRLSLNLFVVTSSKPL